MPSTNAWNCGLCRLAGCAAFHSIVAQAAGPALVGLDSSSEAGRDKTAKVLANMAVEPVLQGCIAEAALSALSELLHNGPTSGGGPSPQSYSSAGEDKSTAMPGLFGLLQDACVSPMARLYAGSALLHMADNMPLRNRVADAAGPLLVTLLQVPSGDPCKATARSTFVRAGLAAATQEAGVVNSALAEPPAPDKVQCSLLPHKCPVMHIYAFSCSSILTDRCFCVGACLLDSQSSCADLMWSEAATGSLRMLRSSVCL